jgi:predicted CoA-binding protein
VTAINSQNGRSCDDARMTSTHERFWAHSSYAVVGHSDRKPFPRLTYRGLKRASKKVYAVDPGHDSVDGDAAYADFGALPAPVDAAVLELPREETAEWVEKALAAGIRNIWLHQRSDTKEAVALAEKAGASLLTGSCAVMYLNQRPSYHSIHRLIAKLTHRY